MGEESVIKRVLFRQIAAVTRARFRLDDTKKLRLEPLDYLDINIEHENLVKDTKVTVVTASMGERSLVWVMSRGVQSVKKATDEIEVLSRTRKVINRVILWDTKEMKDREVQSVVDKVLVADRLRLIVPIRSLDTDNVIVDFKPKEAAFRSLKPVSRTDMSPLLDDILKDYGIISITAPDPRSGIQLLHGRLVN